MPARHIGEEFIERTKYRYLGRSDQAKGVEPPPLAQSPPAGARAIQLPAVDELPVYAKDLTAAFRQRRSVRRYSPEPLTLAELTYLLWYTQGVVRQTQAATFRTVPSAGARHPLETYLLLNRVAGLAPGLYRYEALSHTLLEHDLGPDACTRVVTACLGQEFVGAAAATIIWVAVPYRTAWRYQERAYRYILLDAGHVCQNLYLACQAIDCGCCAVAAFDDDALNAVVSADGRERFAVYVAAVGKKPAA
jgi:SagB-type dehydrogenase family enzyme